MWPSRGSTNRPATTREHKRPFVLLSRRSRRMPRRARWLSSLEYTRRGVDYRLNTRSLRTEIVAGFAALVVALALMGGYAFLRQARAVEALRLQNQGYLPLSLAISEAHSNQSSMDTILER